MKLTEQNQSLLVITDVPWMPIIILGAVCVALGLLLVIKWSSLETIPRAALAVGMVISAGLWTQYAHQFEMRFSRSTGTIEISRSGVFDTYKVTLPLAWFREARLEVQEETNEDAPESGIATRVILVFDEALPVHEQEKLDRMPKGSHGTLAPNEVPLTPYFTNSPNEEALIKAINEWVSG